MVIGRLILVILVEVSVVKVLGRMWFSSVFIVMYSIIYSVRWCLNRFMVVVLLLCVVGW